MARSRKEGGTRRDGREYWSRRPNCNGAVGKFAKQIIHGQERIIAKNITRHELHVYFAE